VVFAWNCRRAWLLICCWLVCLTAACRALALWVDAQSGAVILRYNDIKTPMQASRSCGNGRGLSDDGVILPAEGGPQHGSRLAREQWHSYLKNRPTHGSFTTLPQRYPDA
jgi:hypothetical protein